MSKQDIYTTVDELKDLCTNACRDIWARPELSGEENYAAEYYEELLRKEGFRIENNEYVPRAFIAEWGSGHPVMAIIGEYDALPGFSQKVAPVKAEIEPGGSGHACGHNLLGAASATAAIALKNVMEKDGIDGTVRFYGCPEEELLCGKVKMIYYNMFDGCDFAFSWHPNAANMVFDNSYLANASARFYFTGVSSHAGFAPQNGRSALDAVEIMNVGVQYLREHVIDGTRIHYTTDSCGYAPNIVHPNANSWYYVRAPYMTDVKETLERVKKCARGAAMMTETQVRIEVESGCCEMLTNNAFGDITQKNLLEVELPVYTEEEMAFARKIQDSLSMEVCARDRKTYGTDGPMFEGVADRNLWEKTPMKASTDTGDVSYIMPMNLFTAASWPVGVAPHTWQAAACAGSSIGEKAALYAAKVIAATAYDLATSPEDQEKIRKEFEQRRPDNYVPMYEG